MASVFRNCYSKGLLTAPKWIHDNIQWEVMMGSEAYGCSSGDSDIDVYGWAINHKDDIFPQIQGKINWFDDHKQFTTWQQHHVENAETRKEYDFSIYGICDYFKKVAECNPNMIDSLFVPRRCIFSSTYIGEMVRERRKIFLHKGSWHKFRGYAFAQMSKIRGKNSTNPKRAVTIEKYGYDTKFAVHVVRLLLEIQEIMSTGDLHLDLNSSILKTVRAGEWSLEHLSAWFEDQERALETIYASSTLPNGPDISLVRKLLLECLEQHYGSLTTLVAADKTAATIIRDIETVLERYR